MPRQIIFHGDYFTDFYKELIYRVFCCFDEGKLIVLFNGFQKKTQKTPINEIEKAMRIKKEYFESKKYKHD